MFRGLGIQQVASRQPGSYFLTSYTTLPTGQKLAIGAELYKTIPDWIIVFYRIALQEILITPGFGYPTDGLCLQNQQ